MAHRVTTSHALTPMEAWILAGIRMRITWLTLLLSMPLRTYSSAVTLTISAVSLDSILPSFKVPRVLLMQTGIHIQIVAYRRLLWTRTSYTSVARLRTSEAWDATTSLGWLWVTGQSMQH